MLTSHRERLETFGSHLINCVLTVCVCPHTGKVQDLILLQHSGDGLRLPQLIRLMVIGWWLVTRI